MLVFVATHAQFEKAFLTWIDETGADDRKIIHRVFNAFIHSVHARGFHTSTGLICFYYAWWQEQFALWRDAEIKLHPEQIEAIRFWSERLSELLQSSWSIQHKLIVRECLDENDDVLPVQNVDLFDSLVYPPKKST